MIYCFIIFRIFTVMESVYGCMAFASNHVLYVRKDLLLTLQCFHTLVYCSIKGAKRTVDEAQLVLVQYIGRCEFNNFYGTTKQKERDRQHILNAMSDQSRTEEILLIPAPAVHGPRLTSGCFRHQYDDSLAGERHTCDFPLHPHSYGIFWSTN